MDNPTRENIVERSVQVYTDQVTLEGNLRFPEKIEGMVVFVHGSGSSRLSPRNQYVARQLQEGGLATLLFDLLTREEEQVDMVTRHLRFDIDLLARRTIGAVDWLSQQTYARELNTGLFGSSTGAAAALIAAAERSQLVHAVVSRGGRPDLAGPALPRVKASSLFIVGELDRVVIDLNERAMGEMSPEVEKRLEIVPGASHLFEEPGTLEQAAGLARDWFRRFLKAT
jgi:dienelactone hydrolase